MKHDFTAIIVDDEPVLRYVLDKLLSELWPELEIISQAANGNEALRLINEQMPDLLFLDIRMPGLDGISLAKQLAEKQPSPLIIFTTAYDQYAVEAFESEAVDYILKPINERRMIKTIEKAKSRLRQKNQHHSDENTTLSRLLSQLSNPQTPQYLDWIKASRNDNIHLLSPDDILYFQSEDKYTSVFTPHSEYLIRTSIKDLKAQLHPQQFWQIHRGTLVRLDKIDKVKRDISGRMFVHLKDNKTKLAVSRSFQNLFKQM